MSFYHFAPALGYLRADLSGIRQPWDEIRMRHLAPRLGYNLRKTIVFTAATTHRIERLLDQVDRHGAEAVFVPGRHHLDGQTRSAARARRRRDRPGRRAARRAAPTGTARRARPVRGVEVDHRVTAPRLVGYARSR
ncbi:hypothetical protein [Nocardia farcinica]|uniref:hypothetical protein n=1 Tax=Nocardia farcinica TaxID=37329 RepID=UPI0037B5B231